MDQTAATDRVLLRHVPPVRLDFEAFGPAEATRITGAPNQFVRNLKRAGLLAHTEGVSRYDIVGLAYLLAIRLLSARGGPELATPVAKIAAFGIAWHALLYRDAYEGDHERILSWEPETFAKIESWQAHTALLRRTDWSEGEARAELCRLDDDGFAGWAVQADWLRAEFCRLRGITAPVHRYFAWWANGQCTWQSSLDGAFAANSDVGSTLHAGAVVVLDQELLGARLVLRAKRPFVKVSL